MDPSILPQIEKEHVLDVYNHELVHPRFSVTRKYPWPSVKKFILDQSPDNLILEIGCGNGKNISLRPDRIWGCDITPAFVYECQDKGYNVVQADCTNISYPDNYFDSTMSIAVFHHLSTVDRRVAAIEEMVRLTKPSGSILIEVWALENNNKATDGPDTMVTWTDGDTRQVFHRYYHFFMEDEIRQLVESVPGCEIQEIKYECYNWLVYLKKI